MKTARYLPLLLCLAAGPSLADTPIELRHDASATAHISVSNIAGSVKIVGWDRNEVQVSGRLGDGAKPLAITGSNDDLEIKVQAKGDGSGWLNWGSDSNMAPTSLELHVPRAASLEVDVISASLNVDGVDGGAIEVDSVSGNVRVDAHTPSLEIDSVSGDIVQAGHAGRAELQSVSGGIVAPALGNEAALQSISGNVRADGGPWQKLTISTVSGDVELRGGLAADGHISIDSMSGDVQLQLPAGTSGRLHASSFSGDLDSAFGTPKEPEHGPGSSLDVQLGDGDGHGKIEVETFSGDVTVADHADGGR